MATVGERLKKDRERLGLQQGELAERVGVTRSAQSRYESGERDPKTDYWAAASEHGIDVLYVLTGHRSQASTVELSREEETLLDNYRQSGEKGRAAARSVLDALAQPKAPAKKAS